MTFRRSQHKKLAIGRVLVACILSLLLLLPAPGCGILIFNERQGQTHSGRLDPNILILDGIGLLFFIVPGLVAFVVDFATETIYLPPGVQKGEGPFITDPVGDA